jgi:lysophospholipase L1-like esterase
VSRTTVSLVFAAAAAAGLATAAPQAQPVAAPEATVGFPGQWRPHPTDWKYPVWPKGCARFEGQERIDCLEFVSLDYGRLARFAPANAALAAPKPGEARVVFFGDSITDGWSRPENGGFFPGKPYVNRGIGGQTTAQMLVRFRPDVIALRPKAVVILAGTNDVAGNAGTVDVGSIQDNLASMAELARAHGIKVVLASLLPVSDDKKDAAGQAITRTRQRPTGTLNALNGWLSGYAAKNGHVYLDYFSATADASGLLRPALNDDGLHPNARGYAVMAPLAEKAVAQALKPGPEPVMKAKPARPSKGQRVH